jgi:hypothetical protein
MKNFPTHSASVQQGDTPTPAYLTAKLYQESDIWQWWYSIASPAMPGSTASFNEMERFRRGRIGSQIVLALCVLLLLSIIAGFVGTSTYLIPIVIGAFCALIVAMMLNRMGKVNTAGCIVVLTSSAFPIFNIVLTPDGLSILILPLYGLLVLPLLCAVSFLPPWWVFVVAFSNSIFTLVSLIYLPRTAELSALLAVAFVGVITPIVFSQIIVSVVAYAWVRSTTQALIRADHAEEVAKLEHDMALQAEEAARQKQLLEASIQKIVETHMRVANGDLGARVPLTDDNVLWQISGSLNNLLARAQRWRQEAAQFEQSRMEMRRTQEWP